MYLFVLPGLLFKFMQSKDTTIECKESIEGSSPTHSITEKPVEAVENKAESEFDRKYGARRSDLPTYRIKEVSEHNVSEKRIWVTYRHGVYDITDWVATHPGGKKILLAAGKSLEPFFATYAVHKSKLAMDIMEELRIGNLHPSDMNMVKPKASDDPYYNDPQRHPALKVNSEKPFNAETPIELVADSFLTPNDLFFVRNHLPVPKVDANSHKLVMMGEGMTKPISLSVNELKKFFKNKTITATIQCAGNRRSEMALMKQVKGLPWATNAISNAKWTGVMLSDILKYVGVEEDAVEHIIMQGMDTDIEGVPYEASIPASTAFDPRRDVMIAWGMNGEDLPLDHGYPLRAVIPGVVGARNIKWLSKIVLSKEESQSHWQQNDYKTFNPSIDWNTVDFSKAVAIQEYPVQSAICDPQNGVTLDDAHEVTISGYAWSGGGQGILRVDVSIDGGKTWIDADLNREGKQPLHREWAWTLWETTLSIPEGHKGKLQIVCKATDTSHNNQPDTPEGIWNLRGLFHNAWHRVNVTVPDDE